MNINELKPKFREHAIDLSTLFIVDNRYIQSMFLINIFNDVYQQLNIPPRHFQFIQTFTALLEHVLQ